MPIERRLNQLRGDSNLVSRFEHSALDHRVDIQLPRNLGDGLVYPLYCMTDVREITRRALICPRSVIN